MPQMVPTTELTAPGNVLSTGDIVLFCLQHMPVSGKTEMQAGKLVHDWGKTKWKQDLLQPIPTPLNHSRTALEGQSLRYAPSTISFSVFHSFKRAGGVNAIGHQPIDLQKEFSASEWECYRVM